MSQPTFRERITPKVRKPAGGHLAQLASELGYQQVGKGKNTHMEVQVPVTYRGWSFNLKFDPSNPDDMAVGPGWAENIVVFLENEGLASRQAEAPRQAAQAAPQRASGGGNYRSPGNGSAPARSAPRGGGGWECPVHGNENIGSGYGGHGKECKVRTTDPASDDPNDEWTREKSYVDKSGVEYWYCRHKSGGQ